jgi:hypothetical protein
MRHPVSTPWTSGGGKSRGPMARDVVGLAILPAPPDDAQPGAGQDADGVGVITPARAGAGVDAGGPRRGVPGVIGERRDDLAEAIVARPAKDHRPVLAGRTSDGDGPGFGGQLFRGGEAGAVIAELGEELGRIDLATPRQALDQRADRMVGQGRRDRRREWLDLGDERDQDGDQAADEFATGVALGVARPADRSAAQAAEEFGGGAAAAVGVAAEELGQAALAQALSAWGRRIAGQEAKAIGESTSAKITAAPGQKRSSRARS